MELYDAKVADLLRCNQRDQTFINEVEEDIHAILKNGGARLYYRLRGSIPMITRLWYYFMTSLANIQTLGEEYTGTIRVGTSSNKLPSKMAQTLWLILYVGGEPLIDRFVNESTNNIQKSTSLTPEAKSFFAKSIEFLKNNKSLFKRIHQSIFYINGRYYNISNRLTGIRYVLVRQWFQDDTYTGSFKILGKLSLLYVLFSCIQEFVTVNKNSESDIGSSNISSTSSKGCILCGENIKNPCSTTCGHVFCWDCIYSSLSYQKCCPICREPVTQSRIIFLQNFR